MKILYSAGNRPGAGVQLQRFISNCNDYHMVKTAAYSSAKKYLTHINWTLDALKTRNHFIKKKLNNLFEHTGAPHVDLDNATKLFDDLVDDPVDLVISDCEPIVAHIAQTLSIPLWYCSSLLLLNGVVWDCSKGLYKKVLSNLSSKLSSMPIADRYLIYSPFGDIAGRPMLRDGFEWVTPYLDKPQTFMCSSSERLQTKGIRLFKKHFSNGFFCTGETSFVSDAIYRGNHILISPSINDPEGVLNALFSEHYMVGTNIGNIDSEIQAINEIKRNIVLSTVNLSNLSVQNYPQIHDLLKS